MKRGELRFNFENLGTKFFEGDLVFKSEKLPDLCRQDMVFDFLLYIVRLSILKHPNLKLHRVTLLDKRMDNFRE